MSNSVIPGKPKYSEGDIVKETVGAGSDYIVEKVQFRTGVGYTYELKGLTGRHKSVRLSMNTVLFDRSSRFIRKDTSSSKGCVNVYAAKAGAPEYDRPDRPGKTGGLGKCSCGVTKVYGASAKPPMHSDWCALYMSHEEYEANKTSSGKAKKWGE